MSGRDCAGLPCTVIAPLARFLDEEDGLPALQDACAKLDAAAIDISALLDWLQRYRCDPSRKALASRVLRAALRLPVIPGPVCRSDPPH